MKLRTLLLPACALILFVTGCGTPYIDAGGKLAQGFDSGTAILSKGIEGRSATVRQHLVLSPRAPQLAGGVVPAKFIALACVPFDRTLARETVALANVQAYSASVKAHTTAPKETDLGSTLSRLASAQTVAKLDSVEKPADELNQKLTQQFDACAQDIKTSFVTPAATPPIALVVAVYPKLKELATLLASQAEKKVREERFKRLLMDDEYQKSFAASLEVLDKSASTGQLSIFIMKQRQLALWSAYANFVAIESASPTTSYLELAKSASAMSEDLSTFDALYQTNFVQTVANMRKLNEALVSAAKRGELPKGNDVSGIKELIESLDFLVSAADKYDVTRDALVKAKKE